MTMRRQKEQPDGSVITEETPVRLSIKEMFALICAVLFVAGGGYKSYLNLQSSLDQVHARLTEMERNQKQQDTRLAEQVEATHVRLSDWNPWRWRVSYDISVLGKKTGTEVLTREEK